MPKKTYFMAYLITGVGLLLLSVLILSIGSEKADLLKREGGIIETASAAGYFICAAYMIFAGGKAFLGKYIYFPILILLFGLRELDLDKAFTTMGIFKSRFYISPEVPLWEKAVGGLFILLLLWILYSLVRHHGAAFVRGMKRFDAASIGALFAIILTVVAKGIDGIPRKLGAIGISSSDAMTYRFGVVEEVLELGIPICIFLSFHAWLTDSRGTLDGSPEAH